MLSVIIPAHNEEHELPRTLAALAASLRVAGVESEVIVVDDSSTDATGVVARRRGARVVRAEARQIAAARNTGAAAARGDLLLFVDADTRVTPEAVCFAVGAMKRGAVGGGARVRHEGIGRGARLAEAALVPLYFLSGCAAGCFLFARREVFDAVGGFDEAYFASEELHLSLALKRRGRFTICPRPVWTSGRKIRMYGIWGLVRESVRIALGGPKAVQRREGLDLWYNGRRESDAPSAGDETS